MLYSRYVRSIILEYLLVATGTNLLYTSVQFEWSMYLLLIITYNCTLEYWSTPVCQYIYRYLSTGLRCVPYAGVNDTCAEGSRILCMYCRTYVHFSTGKSTTHGAS
jgi:hypothetical protein